MCLTEIRDNASLTTAAGAANLLLHLTVIWNDVMIFVVVTHILKSHLILWPHQHVLEKTERRTSD